MNIKGQGPVQQVNFPTKETREYTPLVRDDTIFTRSLDETVTFTEKVVALTTSLLHTSSSPSVWPQARVLPKTLATDSKTSYSWMITFPADQKVEGLPFHEMTNAFVKQCALSGAYNQLLVERAVDVVLETKIEKVDDPNDPPITFLNRVQTVYQQMLNGLRMGHIPLLLEVANRSRRGDRLRLDADVEEWSGMKSLSELSKPTFLEKSSYSLAYGLDTEGRQVWVVKLPKGYAVLRKSFTKAWILFAAKFDPHFTATVNLGKEPAIGQEMTEHILVTLHKEVPGNNKRRQLMDFNKEVVAIAEKSNGVFDVEKEPKLLEKMHAFTFG